ncbi:peptidylprolyl isomerase [Mesobaculum littorinae]|uniref:Parvulin-like PPIase n=1 Tax=Mesobaculum littorinae TaxID=2486419 RepID=A0A438AGQ6_9RHOB|nr:peptidylprolyl isomerase [Mesobaculum littorinae]RVV97874.1 peptidylprolyl isomerase [Mesobaculum littorinae]
MSATRSLWLATATAALFAFPLTAQENTSDTASDPAATPAETGTTTDTPVETEGETAGNAAEDGAAQTPASDVTADTVVATVNGTDITVGHMVVLGERLPEQYQSLPDEVLYDGILEQLIQQTALGAQAGDPTERTELVLENERRALVAQQVIEEAARTAVTEEAVQAAYEEAFADAEPQTEWNASHILVESEEEAQAIIEELDGGADFATLAEERSTGPSGPSGGELGWFGPGMMVAPFEEAVQALETGEISDPVETQFGWHVLKLNETRQKDAPPLEEVRGEIEQQVQQAAVEALIAEATANVDVTEGDTQIDPAVIRDSSLFE